MSEEPRVPLLCRWAHDIDPEGVRCAGVEYCLRCHGQVDGSKGVRAFLARRWWAVRYPIQERWQKFARWVSKCPDCDARWGHHSNDCIPF